MDIQREIADKYQDLFNLMSNEHNLTLTISEMDDIIHESQKVVAQYLNISGEIWLDKKWDEYRRYTNNEDAWSFKEWLKKSNL